MRKLDYDVLVVGGGLLGCFTARSFSRYDLRVALLERHNDLAMEVSRANTAIVYPGYDNKPGSLKTQLTLEGNRTFPALCQELDVPFRRCGSLMTACGPRGEGVLRRKLEQGLANGVEGLRLLSGEEARALEGALSPAVTAALYAPTTGVVNPWQLCIAAAENAWANGVEFFLNTAVTAITPVDGGWRVRAGAQEFSARAVVNCAGLHADEVAAMAHRPKLRILPSRGDYLVLDTKAGGFLSRVIFHEPEVKGKGATLSPTADGNLLLGPSELEGGGKDEFATSAQGLAFVRAAAQEVAPGVPLEHTIRSFAARRPNPFWLDYDPDTGAASVSDRSIRNFHIEQALPGFVSLAGIKTPGLTCSRALGDYVARMLLPYLGDPLEKPSYDPRRPGIPRFAQLSPAQQAALVARDPAYGRLVCRCRTITEGEVLSAIRRPLGATTLDGVKRRVGTSTGRCQGAFCTMRVLELLARELGIPAGEVPKDGPGSWVVEP